MKIREAHTDDIPQMQIIRNAVRENTLSEPGLISYSDYEIFITQKGKGWVCETDGNLVGFSIVDLTQKNIWALFVHPDFDNQGVGGKLHDIMLDWYFGQTNENVWLGTAPQTRAGAFYRKKGWIERGSHGAGEIRFEMTAETWRKRTGI